MERNTVSDPKNSSSSRPLTQMTITQFFGNHNIPKKSRAEREERPKLPSRSLTTVSVASSQSLSLSPKLNQDEGFQEKTQPESALLIKSRTSAHLDAAETVRKASQEEASIEFLYQDVDEIMKFDFSKSQSNEKKRGLIIEDGDDSIPESVKKRKLLLYDSDDEKTHSFQSEDEKRETGKYSNGNKIINTAMGLGTPRDSVPLRNSLRPRQDRSQSTIIRSIKVDLNGQKVTSETEQGTHESSQEQQICWTIQVRLGDITSEDVDVVVNAANGYLAHGGGVAGAIIKKGGSSIQKESDAWVKAYGPVPVGKVAMTGAGLMIARCIVHTVGPVYEGGKKGESKQLRDAIYNALVAANNKKWKSISIPAISSGIFGYPKQEVATTLFVTTLQFIRDNPKANLREIRFTNWDKPTTNCVADEFDNVFSCKSRRNTSNAFFISESSSSSPHSSSLPSLPSISSEFSVESSEKSK